MNIRPHLHEFILLYDWDVVARCILGEAEGESELGKLAIGCVIRNRFYSPKWPSSYHEVVLQDKQFSCFNEGSNRLSLLRSPERSRAYNQCIRIAKSVIMESALDITGGADHYINESLANPSWKTKMIKTCKIGNHTFYLSLSD